MALLLDAAELILRFYYQAAEASRELDVTWASFGSQLVAAVAGAVAAWVFSRQQLNVFGQALAAQCRSKDWIARTV